MVRPAGLEPATLGLEGPGLLCLIVSDRALSWSFVPRRSRSWLFVAVRPGTICKNLQVGAPQRGTRWRRGSGWRGLAGHESVSPVTTGVQNTERVLCPVGRARCSSVTTS